MSHSIGSSFVFFFKQKTAYEMRISEWSSDVCSSDLAKSSRLTGSTATLASCADERLDQDGAKQVSELVRRDFQIPQAGDGTEDRSRVQRRQDKVAGIGGFDRVPGDRKSTRLNSSH